MWFPFYQATSDAYWKTYVAYDALLADKAALLAGYQPFGDAKVLLDRHFHPNRGLEVTLLGPMNAPVTLNAGTGAFVDVLVGGKQAKGTNEMEFVLPPGTLPSDGRGAPVCNWPCTEDRSSWQCWRVQGEREKCQPLALLPAFKQSTRLSA